MPVVPVIPGVDERVVLVSSVDGSAVGTVGSPLFTSVTGGGAGGTSAVDEAAWTAGVSSFNPIGGAFNDSAAALTSGQQGQARVTPNRALHVSLRTQAGAEIIPASFPADAAAWTTGVTTFSPGGGVFNDSAAALTSGQQGTQRLTAQRAEHVNLRNNAGTELGTAGAPVRTDPTGSTTQPVSGTVTANAGTGTFAIQATAAAPASVELSDGAAFYTGAKTGQFPSALVGGRLDVNLGASAATVTVAGTVTANVGTTNGLALDATLTGRFPSAAAAADATANPTVTQIEAMPMVWNGTNWDRWKDMAAAQAQAAFTGIPAVGPMLLDTGTSTTRRQVTAASTTSGVAGTQIGSTATAAYDGTNFQALRQASAIQATSGVGLLGVGPLHQAFAHGANPASVTAGQYAFPPANRAGVPFVIGGHPNIISYTQNFTAAQTDVALVTVTAGTKIVCTGLFVTCSNANSVNVSARIGFGTAVVPAYGAAGIIGSHPNIAAGSGFGRGGGSGMIGVGADDEDLRATISVPTGGSVDVTVSYYTVPS